MSISFLLEEYYYQWTGVLQHEGVVNARESWREVQENTTQTEKLYTDGEVQAVNKQNEEHWTYRYLPLNWAISFLNKLRIE